MDNPGPVKVFLILADDTPVGMIQASPGEHTVGIDYFIGDGDRCGQGLGTAAIVAFTALVFDRYPDITMITADPARDNHASRRALEKAGYMSANVIYTFERPR